MPQCNPTGIPGDSNIVRKMRTLGRSTVNLRLASRAATTPPGQTRPGRLSRFRGRLKSSLSLRNLKNSVTGAAKDVDSDPDSEPSTPTAARVVFPGASTRAGYISCPALSERASDYATFYEEQRYEISYGRMNTTRLRKPRANTTSADIFRPILPRSELIEIGQQHEKRQPVSTLKPPPWYQPPSRGSEDEDETLDARVSIDSTVNRWPHHPRAPFTAAADIF